MNQLTIFLVSVYVFFAPGQTALAATIRCRDCTEASTLSDCSKLVTCDKTMEECFMDEIITDSLTIVYNGGCRAKDVCSGIGRKRGGELVACSRCCDADDDCNTRLCGIKAGSTPSVTASELKCRQCNRASTLADCNTVVTCDQTLEDCYMDELITDQLTVVYEGGCRSKDVCTSGASVSPSIGKKRSDLVACSKCCSVADGCNTRLCGIQNAHAQTTQIPAANTIKCRLCHRASTLSDCNKVVTCDSTIEDCYMDELITDNLTVVYEGGCRTKQDCSSSIGTLGKHSDLVACSRCCNFQEDCNKRLCSIKDDTIGSGLHVPVGSEFTLNCSDPGVNQQNASWSKVNACGANVEIAKGSLFHQQHATVGDSGRYICTYSDQPGRTAVQYFHVNITSNKQHTTCTFDGGSLCGWQQQQNDSFDWTLQSGPTQSAGTGPDNDHTLGTANGKYLYIESSSPRMLGEFAILSSPVQPANQTKCFEFWYYMFGDGSGGLYVLSQDTCLRNETEIFRHVGEIGARWNKASITIADHSVPHDYRIVVKADVGPTYHGDTSIDDLAVRNGQCQGTQGAAIVG